MNGDMGGVSALHTPRTYIILFWNHWFGSNDGYSGKGMPHTLESPSQQRCAPSAYERSKPDNLTRVHQHTTEDYCHFSKIIVCKASFFLEKAATSLFSGGRGILVITATRFVCFFFSVHAYGQYTLKLKAQ